MYYDNAFGYIPAHWVTILAVILFSIAFILHVACLAFTRKWLVIVPIIGTIGELAGWACRLDASYNPDDYNAFLGQIIALIIAPVFYSAQAYVLFHHIVLLYGPRFSVLSPKLYGGIFITFDIIALILQAAGGGVAGGAESGSQLQTQGSQIMLGGICFQLFTIVVFSILFSIFFIALYTHHPIRPSTGRREPDVPYTRVRTMSCNCLALATFAMVVRSVYRVIELAQGWEGAVITHEVWFDIFDFIPMIFTSALLIPSLYPALERSKLPFTEKHVSSMEYAPSEYGPSEYGPSINDITNMSAVIYPDSFLAPKDPKKSFSSEEL